MENLPLFEVESGLYAFDQDIAARAGVTPAEVSRLVRAGEMPPYLTVNGRRCWVGPAVWVAIAVAEAHKGRRPAA